MVGDSKMDVTGYAAVCIGALHASADPKLFLWRTME